MEDIPISDLRTVCGSKLPENIPLISIQFEGQTHYFCELVCLHNFKKDPPNFLRTHRPDPAPSISFSDIDIE